MLFGIASGIVQRHASREKRFCGEEWLSSGVDRDEAVALPGKDGHGGVAVAHTVQPRAVTLRELRDQEPDDEQDPGHHDVTNPGGENDVALHFRDAFDLCGRSSSAHQTPPCVPG